MSKATHATGLTSELPGRLDDQPRARSTSIARTTLWVLVSGACYYLATQIAWSLCFPDSKVSLFFPPHAVLVATLLLVPTRDWWAYALVALSGHFLATQQAGWPPLYALHCEAFDLVQNVLTAGGIRLLLRSPLKMATLRDAMLFVLIAVMVVPFGTAFWGAAFTISNHFGTYYWIEWRNLGISNAVTAVVLVPAMLLGVHHMSTRRTGIAPARMLEGAMLGAGLLTIGYFVFDRLPAGPGTSPPLVYASIPLLVWAALRFGLGGVSAGMLVITVQAIWGTMHGRGPFLTQTPAENALALQVFLLVTATPLMFLAVVIEEERHSQKRLRESEERYRAVVDSQTDLVCRHLADATLTFANDAYCRFLGRRREELLGQKLVEFIPLPARETVSQHLALPTSERGGISQEIEMVSAAGNLVWFQWQTYPVKGADGKIIEFQAIGHDISDRKRADEASRNLAHATRVSTVGAMAGSLAHELNQPLTAILNNAQAGSRFLAEPAPDLAEVREMFQDIAQDTKRASEVIRHLRTLVKKEDLRVEPLDLDFLIQDVVRLLHSDAVIRRVQIVLECHNGLLPVHGDGVQLQQVMLNLLLNAFDAMKTVPDDARTVRVCTRPVGGDFVQIEISDSGTGLPPEQLTRLFEPFETTKQDGLGLGLAISRSIIEAHGGRLWGLNNPDRGATFCLTVPVQPVLSNSRMSPGPAGGAFLSTLSAGSLP